jgi:hypothetical protein
MNISVIVVSRGRHIKLEEYLHKLYAMAKFPTEIETLIRVDDDDLETISSFTPSFCGVYRKRIRMFKAPRIGIKYMSIMQKQLIAMSSGKIIYPFADDCDPRLQDWDSIMLEHKDKAVVIGWKARMCFTRLAYDTIPEVNSCGESVPGKKGPDSKLACHAIAHGCYITIPRLWGKVQPKDKTIKEGTYGGWVLKDLNLIESELVEI